MSRTLSARGLRKSYRGSEVVGGVDITVQTGEVIGLLGPNGAGKTTSFYMIVGLIRPDAGQIFLDDLDLTKMPMFRRAAAGISYLPQEASVFRKMTVEDNLLAILELLDLTTPQRIERKDHLLEQFHLTQVAKSYGYALSGGERRRVEIARALVIEPTFILLDEPFAGIDPIAVIDIQNIIMQLKASNIGVLISDHNVRETLGVCDKAYILSRGKILEYGEPAQIAESPRARSIYLGETFKL